MELLDEMEAKYAPHDDPGFQLVPPLFDQCANVLYNKIGQPAVSSATMWDVYRQLLHQFHACEDAGLDIILTSHCSAMEDFENEPKMEVLNMKPFRLGSDIGPKNGMYIGGALGSGPSVLETDDRPEFEYGYFTTDNENSD